MGKRESPSAQGSDHRQHITAVNAELDDVGDRLEARLREQHPELFDAHGCLKQRALSKLLIESAGKTALTKAEVREKPEGPPRTEHA